MSDLYYTRYSSHYGALAGSSGEVSGAWRCQIYTTLAVAVTTGPVAL